MRAGVFGGARASATGAWRGFFPARAARRRPRLFLNSVLRVIFWGLAVIFWGWRVDFRLYGVVFFRFLCV